MAVNSTFNSRLAAGSVTRDDPRLRTIVWRDLLNLRRFEIAYELTLGLPWLLAPLAAAHWRVYPLALLASFMFFLTGLRQVHNAYHYALGIPRAATEWVMLGWTVHHDCAHAAFPARTVRHPLKARLAYSMFYHVEHHLFPTVPTCRLSILAQRMDDVAPDLGKLRVF